MSRKLVKEVLGKFYKLSSLEDKNIIRCGLPNGSVFYRLTVNSTENLAIVKLIEIKLLMALKNNSKLFDNVSWDYQMFTDLWHKQIDDYNNAYRAEINRAQLQFEKQYMEKYGSQMIDRFASEFKSTMQIGKF